MKQVWRAFFTIIIFLPINLSAQQADRFIPHIGFLYEVISDQDAQFIPSERFDRFFYVFSVGTFYMIAHNRDLISIGLDPNVHLGFNFLNTGDGVKASVLLQLPHYLMLRVGANSTHYNEQKIGMGMGIGGNFNFFSEYDERGSATFWIPSAIFEATIMSQGNTLTGRIHFSLASATNTLNIKHGTLPRDFSNWGLGLLYGF